jgi:hypothetical protein
MRPELLGPRRFFTVDVDVTNLRDLRASENWTAVALDLDALAGPWKPCQRVGLAAHQLGLHGVIAPAATGSASRSRCSSTTCPPSSGRRSPTRPSGPTFRPTPGACAPSTTSQPDPSSAHFDPSTGPLTRAGQTFASLLSY